MKKKVFISITGLLILVFPAIFAQKGIEDGSRYGHGEDSVNCVTNLSLYRTYAQQKDYTTAVKYWRLVFRECPISSKNIYIDGVKIYKDFIENEMNSDIQAMLVDTLMMVYDQRIKYYPRDRADQRGRQGVDLLRYRRNDDIKFVKQAYGYLEESIKLDKNETSEAVIATFFTSAVTLFQNSELDEGKLAEDYILCTGILLYKLKKSPNDNTLLDIKSAQDDNFQRVEVNCGNLILKLEPLFKKNEKDILTLQIITSTLRIKECTNNELFYQAAKNYHELAPSAESAANIAVLAYDKGNYTDAIEYFKQAIQLETVADINAKYFLGLAKSLYKMNKKSEAKENALKAANLKQNWGDPYIFIGQMYAESVDDCSDLCLPKSVYWAAVDKFNKAKLVDPSVEDQANKLILTYSGYFPNKENSFFCGINDGDTYTITCWINETTKARF